jgi:hypothetical protein
LLTAEQRTLRARLAAFSQHAQHDVRETTAAARTAFSQRFVDQVDPDRLLGESERLRRAEAARRAYFVRLRLLRSQKGSRNKQTAEGQSAAARDLEAAGVDGDLAE